MTLRFMQQAVNLVVSRKTVDEEEFNFIKDEALIRMAKAGPDIHCPYCGTRNPGTAELCSNCGGELSMGGKFRKAGIKVQSVSEAEEPPPVEAPAPKKKRGLSAVHGRPRDSIVLWDRMVLTRRTEAYSPQPNGCSPGS